MERYRAAQGSNDSDSTMHVLAAGPAGKLQFIFLSLFPFVFFRGKIKKNTTGGIHYGIQIFR
jgi:hypothetical protein